MTEPLALDDYSFEEKLDVPEDEEIGAEETTDFNDLQPVSLDEEPTSFEEMDTLDYNKAATANELGFNEDIVNQLLTEFKEQANEMSGSLENAIDNNDFDTLKKLAISIKGASDNLRLNKISKVLEELTSVYDAQQAKQLLVNFKNYTNQI